MYFVWVTTVVHGLPKLDVSSCAMNFMIESKNSALCSWFTVLGIGSSRVFHAPSFSVIYRQSWAHVFTEKEQMILSTKNY
jgi:hypothetical protein